VNFIVIGQYAIDLLASNQNVHGFLSFKVNANLSKGIICSSKR